MFIQVMDLGIVVPDCAVELALFPGIALANLVMVALLLRNIKE